MPAIKLTAFTGEQPRIIPRLLPPSGAKSAINARLDDGSLSPYRASTFVVNVENNGEEGDGALSTIYLDGDEWLGFIPQVHAAPGPVAEDRLYYTGDGVPKLRVGEDTYNLAVPRPETEPTATSDGIGSGDEETRVYVYTFVTAFGEESEPSPPSNDVIFQPGDEITLSGIEDAPEDPDRNITLQRFYRSQTGTVGTDFYFIGERAVGDGDFVDDIAVDQFAEPLPSRLWTAPPDDLEGLIPLPNGMMAGFVGKELYFSEPYRPHAWPEIYVLTTDIPIIALGAMGTTMVVMTEGFPYRVTGTTPSAMVMEKLEANLPCVNARGVVDLGHAIAWPSTDGLAAFRGNGSFGLVSGNLFSPREWSRLNPATMRGGQVNGRWIGAYDAVDAQGQSISGSLIIDISGESFLIRSSVRARAWFADIKTGSLYFLPPAVNEVRQFDSPTGDTETYYWRSKQFVLAKPENFGCILVETGGGLRPEQIEARQELIEEIRYENSLLFDDSIGGEIAGAVLSATTLAGDFLIPLPPSLGSGVTVGIYADKELVATVGRTDIPARLPSGFTAREWEIEVFGDFPIDQITMAKSMDELKVASGGP